jgi:hypothetical protein
MMDQRLLGQAEFCRDLRQADAVEAALGEQPPRRAEEVRARTDLSRLGEVRGNLASP